MSAFQSPEALREKAQRAKAREELPPPNWSPTGNEGWWARDNPDEKWRWIDDINDEGSDERNQKQTSLTPEKKWWEAWK